MRALQKLSGGLSLMKSEIVGVRTIDYFRTNDARGGFEKPVAGLSEKFPEFRGLAELFTSSSSANVWRGFHLQVGLFASNRIIYCASGRVRDFLIDLRPESRTFETVQEIELDHELYPRVMFVPAGVAHGFFSEVDNSVMVYLSDRPHSAQHDTGINYKDVFELNDINFPFEPSLSVRDLKLPNLNDFLSKKYTYA